MAAFPALRTLELVREDSWLTIWFNQPEIRNPLTAAMTEELVTVLRQARDDRTVRGITLRGRGGFFCAGGDLKAFKQMGQIGDGDDARRQLIAMSRRGAEIFDLVNAMPQVVIAVVEGAAMAGGFGLACCADVTIVERGAKFAFSETAIGLTPAQITPFVIQKLGYVIARRLLLTAERFDGARAEEFGFADIVAEGEVQLAAAEQAIRRQVLQCAPGAVAAIKDLIVTLPGKSREQVIQAAAENFTDRVLSDEGREGLAAFQEKRKPKWVRG